MDEADLTRPIDINRDKPKEKNVAARGAAAKSAPAVDREAATVPVDEPLVEPSSPREDAIKPTPAFHAADAEDTGYIVLPEDLSAEEGKPVRGPAPRITSPEADPHASARFLGSFFAELSRCGVNDFVISPGSRSTPLSMVAFETAGDVYVDVDERGAAFFALGLAKAKGNPVALICTSGTAPANWMPAVLEAEASRVPLLLLSADRPPRLQHIAAHQTTDQLALFGGHVKQFYQMPLPASDDQSLAYARQIALDATIAAHGAMPGARSCDAGPVHINFPFEEPLKPAPLAEVRAQLDRVGAGRAMPPTVVPGQILLPQDVAGIRKILAGKRVVALCGEGSAHNQTEAREIAAFGSLCQIPLLADPLSGLRSVADACVIDNYDSVLAHAFNLTPEVVIRFGRWPVSKRTGTLFGECGAAHIVVDVRDTRDATASSSMLVRTTPLAFARSLAAAASEESEGGRPDTEDRVRASYLQAWIDANDEAAQRIAQVGLLANMDDFEGAYVDALFELAPEHSLVFSASSMSIRAIDTFYRKSEKALDLLCNRGLSGIDGTLSSAIGAAQAYRQTTVLTGDLAFLHDANALALQGEMRNREHRGSADLPCVAIVVLNNNGGAIFDMLPQQSDQDYFERLFLTPQRFNVKDLAAAFEVPYRRATTVASMRRAYESHLGQPGLSIIEVPLPLAGVKARYERFW